MPEVYEISLPAYQVNTEPDHILIGKIVDAEIKKHFLGETIVARGIASTAHPNKSVDELVDIIKKLGTDRYDSARIGDRYTNIEGRHIDLFAFRRKVTPDMKLFQDISWGFYHGALAIHGKPVRIDILTIYDAGRLKAVTHQYEGRSDRKRDGFVFKDERHKPQTIKAVFKILG
jgi:hypothetical protein